VRSEYLFGIVSRLKLLQPNCGEALEPLISWVDFDSGGFEGSNKGASVRTSRALIARRFEVTEEHVQTIEREGLDSGWPPL
jgi:hypothetical protein